MYYLGVDTGGTFTDFVVYNRARQQLHTFKVRSIPDDPASAVENGLRRVRDSLGIPLGSIERFIFGTTVATNAVLERKGADCVLLTTRGMRDVLEIQRQWRHRLFDLTLRKPLPLVPRRDRFDVDERVTSSGEILTALCDAEIERILDQLGQSSCQAVAVSLLFSFLDPTHERLLGAAINKRIPNLHITLSSDVCPEFREYERTATTVMNAYTMPTLERLASRLADVLQSAKFNGSFGVIQSNGGIARLDRARRLPVTTLLSGPAAGVVGAVQVARYSEVKDILSFDIGGTSTDITLIENSDVRLAASGNTGGYPVKVPQVPVHTIGAGGGSIARPTLGLLKVGPDSAGADPGPVCYDGGGEEPTGTDAAVVLGLVDPEFFLGGEMRLNRDAAVLAIQERVAVPLGLSVEQASLAIIRVQAANIVSGIRQVSVEVGKDARDFVLVPFGGAGGIYAGYVAKDAGISRILFPRYPSVLSALGMLMTDIRFDRSRTLVARAADVKPQFISTAFAALADEVGREIAAEQGFSGATHYEFSADLRYVGQAYEINVRLPHEQPDFTPDIGALCQLFHEEHRRLYGQCSPQEPVEFVNLRVGLIGGVERAELRQLAATVPKPALANRTRTVMFDTETGQLECPVFSRDEMCVDQQLTGPAIIEESGSSFALHPGDVMTVDSYGNLAVEVCP